MRCAIGGAACLVAALGLRAQSNVLTWHNDNARSGANLQETALTPANVNSSTFGKLFTISADGKVDAQPLYVAGLAIPGQGTHNVLYVMTEHLSAYAFDADTGTGLWHVSLAGTNETPSDDRGCDQVTPEIGITSTPVIDLHSGLDGTLYAVAMSKDASGHYHQRLHALDLLTGAEEFGGPIEIAASYPGSGDEGSGGKLTFDPKQHVERAALALVNGVIYTVWSSHCDDTPYTSWVMGYDEATLKQVTVLNLTPNGSEGGLWQAGAGPAADAAGNLYVLMGNGTFDVTLNSGGFPSKGDYGNGFVKIATAGGAAAVADYFDMSNTVAESNADQDLGSGGAMVLPPLNDAQGNSRTLAVGAGKDGNLYVADSANMGKFNAGSNQIYQEMASALGPVFSSPAWFHGTLYYGSQGRPLQAFPFTAGKFQQPSSQSAKTFGFPGTTPSISANGSSNGIVWAVENSSPAVLHAFDANDLATELYNSNQAKNGRDNFGSGNVFIVPTVVNGKVYVGTTNGVGVFGLLNAAAPSVTVTSVTNGAGPAQTAIAPGEIVTIKGSGLGPAAAAQFTIDAATGGVDTALAGTKVMFGSYAAPILYVSSTQVNAIVPYQIAGQTQVAMQVISQSGTSAPLNLAAGAAAPGIFTANQAGSGPAAVVNQDGSLNSAAQPVTFAGAAPDYVDGLNQLNLQIAAETPPGTQQPIVITAGSLGSPQNVTMAIQ